ncbi:polysaccharide biosynthesis protein [Desulfobulbus propionicus DSM 2032]|uniref:Polysaccharide biosynthesis protein n=1 Tax=Desulfobulbus propionicus (strain ATCC 33891 / DSM 2032 / VKM B-1956 / 1pr3) TaxID=577650 RepID=A0A7U3YJH4_DESPD|nr:oligosaccharide flippase family protein [Desulfobulbus propionicus]ADW16535.1 polysaccharide biosynthesis protein [Desulfobulbus propionicus DSM 2032]
MIIKRIIFNVLSNYAHLFISVVLALVMSPFIVHTLGDFFYGVWSIIAAITGYFSLLDLGINRAIVRYISKYEAENNINALNKFFNTSLLLFVFLGLLIVLATFITTFYLDTILDLKEYSTISKIVFLIVGIDFAFSFPFGAIYAVIIAKQRHTIANKINIISSISRNCAIYASLSFMPDIVILAVCNVFFNLIRNFCIFYEAKKISPEISYKLTFFDKKIIRNIFNYSLYSFAVSVSSRIISFTDEIVVGLFLTVSDVTYYAIAVNLVTYFEKLIWAGASVLVPYISQLDSSNDHEGIERAFYQSFKYTLLFTLFIFFGIIFLGRPFIDIWMGETYGEKAFPVLIILATAKVVSHGQSITIARFLGTSNHKFLGIINSLEALSNLVLSLFLVVHYQLIGVAIGT